MKMRKSNPQRNKKYFISNGVDLIEIKKAKRLYKAHKNRLDSFFSLREIAYIKTSERPHENLAILLASKEAVFKAIPRLGTGLTAFRELEMIPKKKNRFYVCFKETLKHANFKFFVLRNKKYVIVQCAGI